MVPYTPKSITAQGIVNFYICTICHFRIIFLPQYAHIALGRRLVWLAQTLQFLVDLQDEPFFFFY